jgi:hypothetical protein
VKPLTVVTWLWYSDPKKRPFSGDQVGRLRNMLARHLPVPHELVCATTVPDDVPDGIRTVPIEPRLMSAGKRYPKIMLFRRDAADLFGGGRLLSLDLDTVIVRDLTPVVDRPEPLVLWRNSSYGKPGRSPYASAIMLMDAGARPEVYESFVGTPREHWGAGSDQAWISRHAPDPEGEWGYNDADGVFKARIMKAGKLPKDARVVLFHSRLHPAKRKTQQRWPWVREHWR